MKNWYESKTLWSNILIGIGSIGTALAGATDWHTAGPIIVTNVMNIILRFMTSSAIGTPPK